MPAVEVEPALVPPVAVGWPPPPVLVWPALVEVPAWLAEPACAWSSGASTEQPKITEELANA